MRFFFFVFMGKKAPRAAQRMQLSDAVPVMVEYTIELKKYVKVLYLYHKYTKMHLFLDGNGGKLIR
jgi:hypothetical protein